MKKHVGYVCAYCGSSAVLMDAWAEWNAEQQGWVLHDIVTEAFCRECDGETSFIEIELAPASSIIVPA